MANIHISSLTDKHHILNTANLPDQLDATAMDLIGFAEQYKKMAEILRAKNIAILATHGDARCGSFAVDEIDTGRLKQAGLISENSHDYTKAFFIDPGLDKALSKFSEGYGLKEFLNTASEADEILEADFERVSERDQETIDFDSVLHIEEDENGSKDVVLNIKDQENFMPANIFLNKKTNVFEYKCSACSDTHYENFSAVLHSLHAVIALVSNFYRAAIKNEAEMAASAIATLEEDMRLIEGLLRQEYPEVAAEADQYDDAEDSEEVDDEDEILDDEGDIK